MSKATFKDVVKALHESIQSVEQSAEFLDPDYTDPKWAKRFKKSFFKAMDLANARNVKKTGATRGRNADFELAVALDPTEAANEFSWESEGVLKVNMNVLHQDKKTVDKVANEFIKELKRIPGVVDAKFEKIEPATETSTSKAVLIVTVE